MAPRRPRSSAKRPSAPAGVTALRREIAKRRRAEQAWRESAARYRRLADHLTDTVWLLDPATLRITYASPATLHQRGFTLAEINALPLDQQMTPDSYRRCQTLLQTALAPANLAQPEPQLHFSIELELYHQDGSRLWQEVKLTLIRGPAGQLEHLLGNGRDITARKQAEERRRASEQFTEATLNALAAQICVLDEAGVILRVNAAWRSFADANPPTAYDVGVNYLALTEAAAAQGAAGAADCAAGLRAVLRGARDWFEAEYPGHAPATQRWYRLRVTRFTEAAGRVRAVVAQEDISALKLSEAQARASERRYRHLFDHASLAIFQSTLAGGVLTVNPEFARMFGYASPADVMAKVSNAAALFADPNRREAIARLRRQDPTQNGFESVYRRQDGSTFIGRLTVANISGPDGQAQAFEGYIEDITERVQAEAALRESEARYRRIVDTAIEGVVALDRHGVITFVNQQMGATLGWPLPALLGRPLADFIAPADLAAHAEQMRLCAQGQDAVYERCFQRRDGQPHWLLVSAKATLDAEGQFVGSFGMLTDINERKRLEARLLAQATTDGLTGLSNRQHFLELARQEVARARRRRHPLALALLDLDHFKQVNDTYGHAAGDQALLWFTRLLRDNLREIDICARFGGDEFVVLLPETALAPARVVLERLREALTAQPLPWAGQSVPLTLSAGLTGWAGGAEPLEALLERADRALYQAKQAGRNRLGIEAAPNAEGA